MPNSGADLYRTVLKPSMFSFQTTRGASSSGAEWTSGPSPTLGAGGACVAAQAQRWADRES